jgi:hypothetical protein
MTVPMSSVPVSTAPRVVAFLTSGLTANITPFDTNTALGVAYIEQPSGYDPFDQVTIGDVGNRTTRREQMVGTGGTGWLYEDYTLDIEIVSWQGGQNLQLVLERAWRLLGQVEAFIRSDPSLGALVITAYPSSSKSTAGYMDDKKGVSCVIDVTVDVEARI